MTYYCQVIKTLIGNACLIDLTKNKTDKSKMITVHSPKPRKIFSVTFCVMFLLRSLLSKAFTSTYLMSSTKLTSEFPKQAIPLPIPKDSKFTYGLSHFPSKELFETNTTYAALIIPSKRTSDIRKLLIEFLLHRPKTKNVYKIDEDEGDTNTERKIVLGSTLNEKESIFDTNSVIKDLLLEKDVNGNTDIIRKSKFCLKTIYDDFTVEEALRKILPWEELSTDNDNNEFLIPSAFETIGHIAHVNLRDEHLPYRKIIGKVILDKNLPRITMVVNKIGNVQGEFRTFPMEVLAFTKEPDYKVEVREEKCRFTFNFRDVYWNSRLMGEHKRIVQLIGRDNKKCVKNGNNKKRKLDEVDKVIEQPSPKQIIVADVMAGVGPFSIPLTSSHLHQNIIVHANDLNPKSYQYLNENSKLNKCQNLTTYNIDGRKFIHHLSNENILPNYIIMNLPADAPEFLNAFRGMWKECVDRPTVLVHCFAEKEGLGSDDDVSSYDKAIVRCETALGCKLDRMGDEVNVHVVRDVAPKKNMLCVSFLLPILELSKLEAVDS